MVEEVVPLVATSLVVTLVKVAVIAVLIYVVKWVIGNSKQDD